MSDLLHPTTKDEALRLLNILLIDFELLRTGEWEPDDDSCEACMDATEAVIKYVEEMK